MDTVINAKSQKTNKKHFKKRADFLGKLSVIMPAHNEGSHIYKNIQETLKCAGELASDYELVVVNDGSIDNTSQELERISKEYSMVTSVDILRNRGKGHALKEGFKRATGQVIVFLDSDLELHPAQLRVLFNVMRRENADVVIGSKFHPFSEIEYPLMRKIASRVYAFFLKVFFNLPLKDTQSGLKIYKRKVLNKVFPLILSKKWAFDVEMLANAHHWGFRISEAPVVLTFSRRKKWGRISSGDYFRTGIDTLAIFYRLYIVRYYDRLEGIYRKRGKFNGAHSSAGQQGIAETPHPTSPSRGEEKEREWLKEGKQGGGMSVLGKVFSKLDITDTLLRSSIIVFAFSMVGNIAAYFYQFTMSRNLSSSDYGALNSILSITMIAGSFTATIQTVVAKYSAEFKALKQMERFASFAKKSYIQAFFLAIAWSAVLLAAKPFVAKFLHVEQSFPFYVAIGIVAVSFLLPVSMGLLQGAHKFFFFGVLSGGGGLLRFLLGFGLVVLVGLGLNGAMFANLTALLGVLVVASWPWIRSSMDAKIYEKEKGFFSEALVYSLPILIGHVCFAFFIGLDMILVKHYFSSHLSGQYAAAAVLARSIIFVNGCIVAVLLPIASGVNASSGSAAGVLRKGLVLSGIISTIGAMAFAIAPRLFMRVLLGSGYPEGASILGLFSFAMLPYALLQIIMNFNYAVKRVSFVWTFLAGVILEAVLIILFHDTLASVLYIVGGVGAGILVINVLMLIKQRGIDKQWSIPEGSVCANYMPSVSVVIPVKRINAYIAESLSKFTGTDYKNYEIIILPDEISANDFTPEIRTAAHARVIATGAVDPATKRNMAFKHASAEILAFLDDDAYPKADWFDKAVRHFADPQVGAVCGPAVTPESNNIWQKASGAVFATVMGGGFCANRYRPGKSRLVDDFPSVNFFIRKDLFDSLGGFQTKYWPGEDTKLCLDIVRSGKKIIYDPEVFVWHHRRTLFKEHLSQVSRYGFCRGQFWKLYPQTSRRISYAAPSIFVMCLVFLTAASSMSALFQKIFLGVTLMYLAGLVFDMARAAIAEKSVYVGFLTAPGILSTHIIYGIHFLRGLIEPVKERYEHYESAHLNNDIDTGEVVG
ncbi:glycosyltransferase [Elusimicrobiota bacterium]